jgi:hypothetical protein
MLLWIVIEFTYSRTYYRGIFDTQSEADKLRDKLIGKVNYDSYGDMLIGSIIVGPFTLNTHTEQFSYYDIIEVKSDETKVSKKEVAAGDFKIDGTTVTLLQDNKKIDKILSKIETEIDAEQKMRQDLAKLKIPQNVIEEMVKAVKKS